MTPGRRFFDAVAPLFLMRRIFRQLPFILTGAEYTGEELGQRYLAAELHIEVFLPAQVPDSELDAWMESRIYPVMSDIPATVRFDHQYWWPVAMTTGATMMRAGVSADLTYVITYEM
ncbi:phage minor tail U family protein (plasmid) [Escherichia coli]|nr:phage minor tail U family protein [Escherichia coli]